MTNNNYDITIDPNKTYTFTVTDITTPSFKLASSISSWLVTNLTALKDSNNNTVFGKVNTGYTESALKTFSGKPTCDVYINRVEYKDDFDYSQPVMVDSIVLFYLKGANNTAYMKCAELHDYVMQSFIENEDWKTLPGLVSNTFIRNSQLMMHPGNKKWGVMGALELAHKIY